MIEETMVFIRKLEEQMVNVTKTPSDAIAKMLHDNLHAARERLKGLLHDEQEGNRLGFSD